MKFLNALRDALAEILENDESSLIIGEDLADPYGGAFKVTAGLSTRLPDRVLQTPVSEAGFVGIAAGLAYMGYRPIVEIMFGDFLALISDMLINSSSKFRWLSAGRMSGSLLIRAPVGAGRGYGPIHSQCLEKLYFGWPEIAVIAPNMLCNPGQLLKAAHHSAEHSVKIFIEHKLDYPADIRTDSDLQRSGFELQSSGGSFPVLALTNRGKADHSDVAIVCYGGMVRPCIEAAFRLLIEEEITSTVCVPTRICPVDLTPIIPVLNPVRAMVCVEEGYAEGGWGSYLLGELSRSRTCHLPLDRLAIVGANPSPIPADPRREKTHLPSAASIERAVLEML